ncbi:MAG: TlpA disulfide reductase family protein [Verrucomicrobiota bacterium]
MKPLLASLLLLSGTCLAQDQADDASEDPYAGLTPLDAAIERMLSERDSREALDKAIAAARKEGASLQAILEARFLFHVDRREDSELAAMMPELVAQQKKFKLSESEIFGVEEDWLAVVEYVQAIAALQENDQAGFKKHITEAFWLSPRQGAAFAPHIERLRMDEAMKKVRVDFNRSFRTLEGKSISLSSLVEGKKAILLHFWSPWSRECEAGLGDFITTHSQLTKNGIAVVSMIGEAEPEAIADTLDILKKAAGKNPGVWVVDADKGAVSRSLRIQNVPTMALVAPDGRILFNGHPAEDRLWQRLSEISPAIVRPKTTDGH